VSKLLLKKFSNETDGGVAIMAAVMSVALIGATGLGVDTYVAQSSETALRHIVDLSCDRMAAADIASYPTALSASNMTKVFAENLKKGTAASEAAITMTPPAIPDALSSPVTVSATTMFSPTFTAVLGAKPYEIKKSATCSRNTKVGEPPPRNPDPKCNVVLTYLDTTRNNSVNVSTLAKYATVEKVGGGTLNFIYTVVDKDNNITKREFFSNDLQIDPVKLYNNGTDQTMYVQVMNADGSIPKLEKQCITTKITTIPPTYTPKDPPPTSTPSCNRSTDVFGASLNYAAGDMSGRITENGPWKTTSFANYTVSPAVKDVVPGVTSVITVTSKVDGKSLSVPITSNFTKLNQSDSAVIAATAEIGIDPESAFLIAMVAAPDSSPSGSPYNSNALKQRVDNGYILDHIISSASGAWQSPDDKLGYCPASVSPIVIDLTNKGTIETTGISTAQNAARSSVGKTISFDMLGAVIPQKMEWIAGNGQGFLVDNRDGNAAKDMNGKRLFGNDVKHANGYAKLASTFVPDKDGNLTGDSLKGLSVWVDNGDGLVQSGELKSLAELGITSINTRVEAVKDDKGDTLMRSYVIRNNKRVMSEDVWFGVAK
jgi:hypothetical protein